ncbi:MAG: phosphoribosylformylglycinamidine cyclo-ligase [candidate division Zixibacteria bacterium]|nr:phosphoribosylformylglycinamidine cyclo-ligase [candidate division Zixibacteria bacterium]
MASNPKPKTSYTESGVDIKAGESAVEKIKSLASRTFNKNVLSEIGSFGGFFKPDLGGLKNPVLISSADGVGTKLKVAFMTGRHDTVGEDLVNHCVNDILVHGAKPLFFLDYIATGKVSPAIIAEIVSGMSRGCLNSGTALLGGETAEMPDFYQSGEYDLAGFIVGMVDQEEIINGSTIVAGDICIGLASNGLHTNGYTLARKVLFDIAGHKPDDFVLQLQSTVSDALLKVHRCYAPLIHPLLSKFDIHGMAHITGGGIPGNLSRIIPDGLSAKIQKGSWPILPLFNYIIELGELELEDSYSAFNMGIGYIIVLPASQKESVMKALADMGETAYVIGEIQPGDGRVELV